MANNPRAVAQALVKAQRAAQGQQGALALPGGQSAMAYGDWIAGRAPTQGAALPREWNVFMSGAFGPGTPMRPYPLDWPDEGEERPDPRRYQYPVAWNLPQSPPGTEGVKLATFAHLRSIAEVYSVARACVNLRIQEILGLNWDIVPTKAAEKKMAGSDSDRKEFEERRAVVHRFWMRPDRNYFNFAGFLNSVLEDLFVIDAMTIWLMPSRGKGKGVAGSDLQQIWQIDGTSVRPLIDVHGAVPQPPAPAYSQYLHGVPRSDRMTMLTGEDVKNMGEARVRDYRGDQLLYLPYVPRIWTPYGFPPVERALVPIMSGLQRQQYQREYFSEGSVPAVFLGTGNPDSTPQQCRQLQDAINAQATDPGAKHQVIVVPGDAHAIPMRPNPLADLFDELVMNQVLMNFDVMPMELGISPRASTTQSSGSANQMAKASTEINERKALKPLLKWLASVFDVITQEVIGATDMCWHWEGLGDDEDQAASVDTLISKVQSGLLSVDEARVAQGDQPWGLDITSGPVYYTATGVVPLDKAQPPAPDAAGADPAVPGEERPPPNPPGVPSTAKAGSKRDRKARKAVARAHRLARKAGWRGDETPAHAAASAEASAGSRLGGGAHTGKPSGDQTKAVESGLTKMDWTPDRYRHGWKLTPEGLAAMIAAAADSTLAAEERHTARRAVERHLAYESMTPDSQSLADELIGAGAQVHRDGTVTVYHRTTRENAESIRTTGRMHGDEDGIFFSTRKVGQASGYRDSYVELRIPLSRLVLDDIFDDEAHVRIPTRSQRESVDVSSYMAAAIEVGAKASQDKAVRVGVAPTRWVPTTAVDDTAALRELDLIRRRLAKGGRLDGWQRRHIPVDVFDQLLRDLEPA